LQGLQLSFSLLKLLMNPLRNSRPWKISPSQTLSDIEIQRFTQFEEFERVWSKTNRIYSILLLSKVTIHPWSLLGWNESLKILHTEQGKATWTIQNNSPCGQYTSKCLAEHRASDFSCLLRTHTSAFRSFWNIQCIEIWNNIHKVQTQSSKQVPDTFQENEFWYPQKQSDKPAPAHILPYQINRHSSIPNQQTFFHTKSAHILPYQISTHSSKSAKISGQAFFSVKQSN